MTEMNKHAMESINNTGDETEERTCKLRGRSFVTIQSEEKKEKCINKSEESQCELWTPSNKVLFALWEAQKEKRKRKGQKAY